MSLSSPQNSQWYCVRTQTKREHIAAGHLKKLEEIEVFCPRIRYRKATRRGKVWWVEPLFPGYLLVRFDLTKHENTVKYCSGVRGLVHFGSQTPAVPEDFVSSLISQVGESSGSDAIISLDPKLEIGDEIEVASGPLQGMKGTVQSIAPGTERVKVLLEFLGQVQPVSLDLFSILLPSKPLPSFDP